MTFRRNGTTRSPESTRDVAILAKGAGLILAGRIVGRLLTLAGQVFIARVWGPGGFGLYAIGWTVVNLVGVSAQFGLDKAVIRTAGEYAQTDRVRFCGAVLHSVLLAAALGALASIGLLIAAPTLGHVVFGDSDLVRVFLAFAAGAGLFTTLRVITAGTRITRRMGWSVLTEDVSQPLLNVLLLAGFWALGSTVLGAVHATVISLGLAVALGVYALRRVFPDLVTAGRRAPSTVVPLVSFSLPVTLAGLFAVYTARVDRLLVGSLVGTAEAGMYQAASQCAIAFGLILSAFNAVFTPMIADLYGRGETERLGEVYRVSTKWGLYVSLPPFLVVAVAPGDVLSLLFGDSFRPAAVPLLILSSAQLLSVTTGGVGALLIMTGRHVAWLLISGAMLLSSIVLGLMLIPQYGIVGAAAGTAAAVVGLFATGVFWMYRTLRLWPYDKRVVKGISTAAIAAVVLFMLRTVVAGGPTTRVAVFAVAAVVTMGAGLFLWGLDEEERDVLRAVRHTVRRKASPSTKPGSVDIHQEGRNS